jgi:hypothetical protein
MKRDLLEITDAISINTSKKSYWYYSKKPMPCELDGDFHDLIRLFIESSPAGRDEILRKIDDNVAGALQAFSRRMAVWGARQASSELLVKGGIALILDSGRVDMRDTLSVIPLLYHSAMRINVDPGEIFQEVAAYYRSAVSDALIDFLKRTPRDRSLEAWGFEEVTTQEGIYYR